MRASRPGATCRPSNGTGAATRSPLAAIRAIRSERRKSCCSHERSAVAGPARRRALESAHGNPRMKLWSILGNSQKLDGGAMFGNAPRAVWSKWIAPDEQNRIPLACRALLASPLHGKTVLFETGIGAFFEPKLRERYGVQES